MMRLLQKMMRLFWMILMMRLKFYHITTEY